MMGINHMEKRIFVEEENTIYEVDAECEEEK